MHSKSQPIDSVSVTMAESYCLHKTASLHSALADGSFDRDGILPRAQTTPIEICSKVGISAARHSYE